NSSNAILAAVRQMSIAELETLVNQVIAIRAERIAPRLNADETALLARVNQGLSEVERTRMRRLIEKRDNESLAPEEWQELTALTDKLELLHADRLAALADLANVRGVTLDAVIQQLGLHFPDHD
ncbi:MAG TPA: STAS/SEC14 domain-containing protein, partial [Blastocatellia bacterium]|nr:STAS/SEC14 domain-containing protein [Blastocatellia bacterium]